ncbi:hypothetical protein H8K90_12230 [Winogradskyella echinorum]|uniref:Heavy-metal resistance n=1 Tax=Winogradskyella echinorum TaxID=538189 RepID=A0ABR6Y3A9_9FLAO|nr:hypothetical protein [Winogradskyella echinorum]MBC3847154.1 hypothetical protein [Winogradskyella echinorum]MBC5751502.1 hypothetical protein [Winogradskyella echinorum]
MKKNTFLYILLVFLIVVNGFFLINYIGKNNDSRPEESQREKDFIVRELGFNDTQLERFYVKSAGHHPTMMRLSNDIKELKDKLFNKLSDDEINESTIDSITALICDKETEKEKEIFYHFKMIRDIANDKQKEKFNSILMDALRRGDRGNRPRPPMRGEGHRPPPH